MTEISLLFLMVDISSKIPNPISEKRVDELIALIRDLEISKMSNKIQLSEADIMLICLGVIKIFKEEESLIQLNSPIYVAGDIHGQYEDLLRLFNCCGNPDKARFLFMGDYVDRGKQSLETICLLFLYKIKYPNNIFLLRGNHESASVNKVYGFYDECKNRISIKVWKLFCDTFVYLPFSAIVESRIFVTHGGLGPELKCMNDISKIKRPCEVPDEGLICDLVWADPLDGQTCDFSYNERGVSVTFSEDYCQKFVKENDLDLICRAHQVVEEGFEFFGNQNLVTVFTAPNYTGEFNNNGAVMYVDKDLMCSFHILKPKKQERKVKTK